MPDQLPPAPSAHANLTEHVSSCSLQHMTARSCVCCAVQACMWLKHTNMDMRHGPPPAQVPCAHQLCRPEPKQDAAGLCGRLQRGSAVYSAP